MAEPEDETPPILLPCSICSRTFIPESLQKHLKVCEKQATIKKRVFDSSKQRIQGTELAEFLPKILKEKKSEKVVKKPESNWKEKHLQLLAAVRAARGVEPPVKSSTTVSKSLNEKCPHCDRNFGPKAFDRHIEWCKEQKARIPKSPASLIQAKERLEARTKYRAPPLAKSKRTLTREKYASVSQSPGKDPSPLGSRSAVAFSKPQVPEMKVQDTASRVQGIRNRPKLSSSSPSCTLPAGSGGSVRGRRREPSPSPSKRPFRSFCSDSKTPRREMVVPKAEETTSPATTFSVPSPQNRTKAPDEKWRGREMRPSPPGNRACLHKASLMVEKRSELPLNPPREPSARCAPVAGGAGAAPAGGSECAEQVPVRRSTGEQALLQRGKAHRHRNGGPKLNDTDVNKENEGLVVCQCSIYPLTSSPVNWKCITVARMGNEDSDEQTTITSTSSYVNDEFQIVKAESAPHRHDLSKALYSVMDTHLETNSCESEKSIYFVDSPSKCAGDSLYKRKLVKQKHDHTIFYGRINITSYSRNFLNSECNKNEPQSAGEENKMNAFFTVREEDSFGYFSCRNEDCDNAKNIQDTVKENKNTVGLRYIGIAPETCKEDIQFYNIDNLLRDDSGWEKFADNGERNSWTGTGVWNENFTMDTLCHNPTVDASMVGEESVRERKIDCSCEMLGFNFRQHSVPDLTECDLCRPEDCTIQSGNESEFENFSHIEVMHGRNGEVSLPAEVHPTNSTRNETSPWHPGNMKFTCASSELEIITPITYKKHGSGSDVEELMCEISKEQNIECNRPLTYFKECSLSEMRDREISSCNCTIFSDVYSVQVQLKNKRNLKDSDFFASEEYKCLTSVYKNDIDDYSSVLGNNSICMNNSYICESKNYSTVCSETGKCLIERSLGNKMTNPLPGIDFCERRSTERSANNFSQEMKEEEENLLCFNKHCLSDNFGKEKIFCSPTDDRIWDLASQEFIQTISKYSSHNSSESPEPVKFSSCIEKRNIDEFFEGCNLACVREKINQPHTSAFSPILSQVYFTFHTNKRKSSFEKLHTIYRMRTQEKHTFCVSNGVPEYHMIFNEVKVPEVETHFIYNTSVRPINTSRKKESFNFKTRTEYSGTFKIKGNIWSKVDKLDRYTKTDIMDKSSENSFAYAFLHKEYYLNIPTHSPCEDELTNISCCNKQCSLLENNDIIPWSSVKKNEINELSVRGKYNYSCVRRNNAFFTIKIENPRFGSSFSVCPLNLNGMNPSLAPPLAPRRCSRGVGVSRILSPLPDGASLVDWDKEREMHFGENCKSFLTGVKNKFLKINYAPSLVPGARCTVPAEVDLEESLYANGLDGSPRFQCNIPLSISDVDSKCIAPAALLRESAGILNHLIVKNEEDQVCVLDTGESQDNGAYSEKQQSCYMVSVDTRKPFLVSRSIQTRDSLTASLEKKITASDLSVSCLVSSRSELQQMPNRNVHSLERNILSINFPLFLFDDNEDGSFNICIWDKSLKIPENKMSVARSTLQSAMKKSFKIENEEKIKEIELQEKLVENMYKLQNNNDSTFDNCRSLKYNMLKSVGGKTSTFCREKKGGSSEWSFCPSSSEAANQSNRTQSEISLHDLVNSELQHNGIHFRKCAFRELYGTESTAKSKMKSARERDMSFLKLVEKWRTKETLLKRSQSTEAAVCNTSALCSVQSRRPVCRIHRLPPLLSSPMLRLETVWCPLSMGL